jgi:hypothetical protein
MKTVRSGNNNNHLTKWLSLYIRSCDRAVYHLRIGATSGVN